MTKTASSYVYILGSRDEGTWRTYVGWTTNLDMRLAAHNTGKGAKSTRGRNWELLYAEKYKTRGAALSREWHLKRDRSFRKIVLPDQARRLARKKTSKAIKARAPGA